MTVQLVDRGFEPSRGKGNSDAASLRLELSRSGRNALLSWSCRWKQWKRRLSLVILGILLLTLGLLLAEAEGQLGILHFAVWTFCAVLYGGWLTQNLLHDRLMMQVFRELLDLNFPDSCEL